MPGKRSAYQGRTDRPISVRAESRSAPHVPSTPARNLSKTSSHCARRSVARRSRLFAVSYGGRVAGMYAREYPQGVARMVLDSPAPPVEADALN